MSTMPGYQLTIRCFVAADPDRPREMAQAAALVDSLPEHLAAIGLKGATVDPRFVARRRLSPSPPAAADPQAEPPQPPGSTHQAPAATAGTGAAADTSGPLEAMTSAVPPPEDQAPGKASGQQGAATPSVPFNVSLPEALGLACRHPFGKEHPERGRVCAVCEVPMPAEVAA